MYLETEANIQRCSIKIRARQTLAHAVNEMLAFPQRELEAVYCVTLARVAKSVCSSVSAS